MPTTEVVLCLDFRNTKARPRHPYALVQLDDDECAKYVKGRRRVRLFVPDDGPNGFELEWGRNKIKPGDRFVVELPRKKSVR